MNALSGARVAGFLAGLSLVAVLALQSWRVPGATRPGAAGVDLRAVSSGEVGVEPGGSVLAARAVVPGGPAARGQLRLTNRTAVPRLVRARAAGGDAELAHVLEVTMTVRDRVVYQGPLSALAGGAIALGRGASETVDVSVRLPAGASSVAAARAGRWTLTFEGHR